MSTSGFWHKFIANKSLQFGMVKKDTVFSAKSSAVTQHVAGKQLECYNSGKSTAVEELVVEERGCEAALGRGSTPGDSSALLCFVLLRPPEVSLVFPLHPGEHSLQTSVESGVCSPSQREAD